MAASTTKNPITTPPTFQPGRKKNKIIVIMGATEPENPALLSISPPGLITLLMLCASHKESTKKMESLKECTGTTVSSSEALPLHTLHPLRRTFFNRVFASVYTCAILALVYHHVLTLFNCTNVAFFSVTLSLLLSDLVLAFMWVASQSFHMRPVHLKEYPENLEKIMKPSDFPSLDVFICTADPYKEPPINVVNTALSVTAYDYPTEKVSVYVSDDGVSALTLFAFMEAAKFASHWLPFCREKNIMVRSPEVYFSTLNHSWCSETEKIKALYESMKSRVEHVVETGNVSDEYVNGDEEREAFSKWTDGFTSQDHPTVIQVF